MIKMKTIYLLVFFFLFSTLIKAQNVDLDKKITLNQHSGKTHLIDFNEFKLYADSNKLSADSNTKSEPVKPSYIDTLTHNMYGDLLNDDPQYNPKSPLWRPIVGVIVGNFVTCAFNRFILNADYCRISFQTVKNNWNNGWEWDSDRFGVNFLQHPYSGALSYNQARTREYNFYESVPFAFGGSLMWEQTMENTRPSFNDLINTTFTSSFLGEMMYRLSSNVLDDRISGGKRFLRELFAGLIDPPRFIERFETGKLNRHTMKEIYQKEPLNISFYAGIKNVNYGSSLWKGANSAIFNINLIYGNPFEDRTRKPFDFWRVRGDITLGDGRKIVDNVMGYGIIFGTNIKKKNSDMLFGLFQNYDYWDSRLFELGTLGLSGGIFHRLQISKTTDLVTQIHLGIVPLAGVSSPHVFVGERDYNYAGGLQAMFESALNLGGLRTTITAAYYIYGLHNYIGVTGNSITGIFRPKIAVKVLDFLSVGFEFLQYGKDSYFHDFPEIHVRNNEQRIYIMLDSGYFRF
jgi:hypothetical protein